MCREAPDENGHRLESCGHPYCPQCLTWVMHNAPLPLCCVLEDCGKKWVAMDLRQACQGLDKAAAFLGRRAMEVCVHQDAARWKCCPVPGCDYVCNETGPAGKEVVCPVCRNPVCFWCNSLFHYGMSCTMFRALVTSDTFSEKKWASQDTSRRRVCSTCGAALERLGKRRLCVCWRCCQLSCWNCGRRLPSASEARAHTTC